jgi:hypothetical protein
MAARRDKVTDALSRWGVSLSLVGTCRFLLKRDLRALKCDIFLFFQRCDFTPQEDWLEDRGGGEEN